jgi:prepilin-type N-terminal cleavage/methylation domain-containing protein
MSIDSQRTKSTPRGFSLIELIATIAILVVLAGAIAPALGQIRSQSRAATSADNLMQIGQARDMYATDNTDRIFTYTWRGGESYTMPDGRVRTPATDSDAVARQNQEIIMRRTGRVNGVAKIKNNSSRIPHRRFVHIVLMDYLAGDDDAAFVNPIFADPADGDLLNWHERPLDYTEQSSGLPYAEGQAPSGYDQNNVWLQTAVRQRWSFGTSYFSTPFAWQGDGPDNVYGPISSTPHSYAANGIPDLSGRDMTEVLFPSRKVHLFEEFDREQKRQPYFAYGSARPDKLMFDGSINTFRTNIARSAVHPTDPNGSAWRQKYVPLHVFPIPTIEGLGSTRELNMRYMWTKNGLQGFDYN